MVNIIKKAYYYRMHVKAVRIAEINRKFEEEATCINIAPLEDIYDSVKDDWVRELLTERLLPFKAERKYLARVAYLYENNYRDTNKICKFLFTIKNNTVNYNNVFNKLVLFDLIKYSHRFTNADLRFIQRIESDFANLADLITYPTINETYNINDDDYNPYLFNWHVKDCKKLLYDHIIILVAHTDKLFGLEVYYHLVLPHLFSNYPGMNINNYHNIFDDK